MSKRKPSDPPEVTEHHRPSMAPAMSPFADPVDEDDDDDDPWVYSQQQQQHNPDFSSLPSSTNSNSSNRSRAPGQRHAFPITLGLSASSSSALRRASTNQVSVESLSSDISNTTPSNTIFHSNGTLPRTSHDFQQTSAQPSRYHWRRWAPKRGSSADSTAHIDADVTAGEGGGFSRRRLYTWRDSRSSMSSRDGGSGSGAGAGAGAGASGVGGSGANAFYGIRSGSEARTGLQGINGQEGETKRWSSTNRMFWIGLSRFLTFWAPDFILRHIPGMSSDAARQAWRGKITLVAIVLSISAVLVVLLEHFDQVMCLSENLVSYQSIVGNTSSSNHLVSVNGYAMDFSSMPPSENPQLTEIVAKFPGSDLSTIFPTFTALARQANNFQYQDQDIENCIGNNYTIADRWLRARLTNSSYVIKDQTLVGCPLPDGSVGPCFYKLEDRDILNEYAVGEILYTPELIQNNFSQLSTAAYVIIKNRVYDVTEYLNYSTSLVTVSDFYMSRKLEVNDTMFLPQDLTLIILENLGQDITPEVTNITNYEVYIKCMDILFFKGVIMDMCEPEGCVHYNVAVWVAFGLICLVNTTKFMISLLPRIALFRSQRQVSDDVYNEKAGLGALNGGGISWVGLSSGNSVPDILVNEKESSSNGTTFKLPHTLLLVPVYAEPEDILKKTAESLARSNYSDTRKLLMFVCDGMVRPEDSTRETYKVLLDILGYSGTIEPSVHAYVSLGRGPRKKNFARVYSGYYETGSHRVPYVVVVKVGGHAEHRHIRAGNRGKRDSLLLVLSFLERCLNLADNRISPLEYEIYYQLYNVLGIDPREFRYLGCIDADTQIELDAISHLISRLEKNPSLIAVCGEVKPVNPEKNFATIMQLFPFYMNHYVGMAFESFVGCLTTLNGGFAIYRVSSLDIPTSADNLDPTTPTSPRPARRMTTNSMTLTPLEPPPRAASGRNIDTAIEFAPSVQQERERKRRESKMSDDTDAGSIRASLASWTSSNRNRRRSDAASTISLSPNPWLQPRAAHSTVLRELAVPRPDTMHMRNVLLIGEDKYLATALLKAHPRSRLGFVPAAVAYTPIPDSWSTLHGQQRRDFNARFHNLIELCNVPIITGWGWLGLSWLRIFAITKALGIILQPVLCAYAYVVFIRLALGADLTHAVVFLSLIIILFFGLLHFAFRWQFRYALWFLLFSVVGTPIFFIYIPLLSFWQSDQGGLWFDIWCAAAQPKSSPSSPMSPPPKPKYLWNSDENKRIRKRPHGIVDSTLSSADNIRNITNLTEIVYAETEDALAVGSNVDRKLLREYEEAAEGVEATRQSEIEDPHHLFMGLASQSQSSIVLSPPMKYRIHPHSLGRIGHSMSSPALGEGYENSLPTFDEDHMNNNSPTTSIRSDQNPFTSPFDDPFDDDYFYKENLESFNDSSLTGEDSINPSSISSKIRIPPPSSRRYPGQQVQHQPKQSYSSDDSNFFSVVSENTAGSSGSYMRTPPLNSGSIPKAMLRRHSSHSNLRHVRAFSDPRSSPRASANRDHLETDRHSVISRSNSVAGSDLSLDPEEAMATMANRESLGMHGSPIHRRQASEPHFNYGADSEGRSIARHRGLTNFAISDTAPVPPTAMQTADHVAPVAAGGLKIYNNGGGDTISSRFPSKISSFTSNAPSEITRDRDIRTLIQDEIYFILQDADLNSITRRQVKQHLYVQFGEIVEQEQIQAFVNECIEKFTIERLSGGV